MNRFCSCYLKYEKLSGDFHFQHRTRFAQQNSIGPRYDAKYQLSSRSFQFRASKQWNNLPPDIKQAESFPKFKQMLKEWIKSNIQI